MSWLFSGFPQIWQNPRIPPEIKGAMVNLSTFLLLTAVFAFATFKVVNLPRAYFGRCGVFIFSKNIGKIASSL
jgi:hypothetical protein